MVERKGVEKEVARRSEGMKGAICLMREKDVQFGEADGLSGVLHGKHVLSYI